MTVLKRIVPASAFKVGFIVYGFIGLVLGAFCTVATLTGIHFAHHSRMHFPGVLGILAVVLCPITYGLIGGLAALIGAAIYNLASGWVGGLEVDIT